MNGLQDPLELPTLEAGDARGFHRVAGNDGWASELVQAAAWMHLDASPTCLGYLVTSDGRATCGRCDWKMSARISDLDSKRGARFALFVLAWIGVIVGVATTEQQP